MKLIFRFFLLQLFAVRLLAGDSSIIIGQETLNIPTPPGFALVTSDMAAFNQMLDSVVPPDNARLASYFPDELLADIRRGEFHDMPRSMSLQTAKYLVDATVMQKDFVTFKKEMMKKNDDLVAQAVKKLPAQTNANETRGINGVVPFPPHEESGRSLAYSETVTVTVKDAEGKPRQKKVCVTTTFLHARSKILFLYVNGAEHDLEWTRRFSHTWADAILAANPSEATVFSKETPLPKGSNWNTVIYYMLFGAIIGGAIGGGIGLIRSLTKRKPSR